MMFNWHRSFTLGLGAPWKKAKKKTLSESEVVLTHVKALSNEYPVEKGVPEKSASQQSYSQTNTTLTSCPDNGLNTNAGKSNSDHVPALSELTHVQSSCKLLGFCKFESEDSGVELPSGANSPSTPTGSEQSFVVHTRDSSCDSGVLSASSSPAIDHVVKRARRAAKEPNDCVHDTQDKADECHIDITQPLHSSAALLDGNGASSENEPQSLDMVEGKEMGFLQTGNPLTSPAGDPVPVTDAYTDTFAELQGLNSHAQLKRYPTSDSLDEYMDECCRLSEVNQRSSKALGSGLGYLEHICQLIEKIGQLQEHNLRLQKQICGLQKEKKMKQLKEEYFVQHCSCGAARALRNSYQEVKKHFHVRSRPHTMFIQTGNLSDLSMIPEMGGNYDNFGSKGSDYHTESGSNPLMLGIAETSSKTTYEENDGTYIWNRADLQALCLPDQAMRKIENHPWGRVRDLVKKKKLKHQNRLGLSSVALKQSCPQLYRPDIPSSEERKKERNSMIVLGQTTKHDNVWSY
ncbi:uncharacterized protein [Pleurodeles waltl]|uniref:uncharacterized protein isoform X2 n=1 Tax=Pleurodeles waltl TaxID=8319 RepID=UPI003709964E